MRVPSHKDIQGVFPPALPSPARPGEPRVSSDWDPNVLQPILNSMCDGVLVADRQGNVSFWNSAAEEIFGPVIPDLPASQWSSYYQVYLPDQVTSCPTEELPLAKAIRGESVQNVELFTRRGSAVGRWVLANAQPIRDTEGYMAGAVVVVRDISEKKAVEGERRRAEQGLREANRALESINEDLRHFAYAASHDLQEPLRMVRSYSELLSSRYLGKLDEDGEEFIRYIVENVDRIEGLLEALREYWQVGVISDRTPVSTDCNHAFKIAVAHLQSAIRQTDAAVTCDGLPIVMAHELPIVQLFQNLLSNAIKYRSQSRKPEIRVTVERTGEDWLFAVGDNGMGIEPQYLERIFGLFKRLHGSAYPGTGIGLTICSKIVERYGGKIWVESQPGKGSTFKFTLPAGDRATINETESRPD